MYMQLSISLTLIFLALTGCTIVGTEDESTTNMRKQLIGRAVHDHAVEIKKCYDYELKKDPKLPKLKVVMNWEVDTEGHPQKIVATPEDSPIIVTFNKCLEDVFTEIVFPPPAKGQDLKVKYPMVFTPEAPK